MSCWGGDGYFKNRSCTPCAWVWHRKFAMSFIFTLSKKSPNKKSSKLHALTTHSPLQILTSKRCSENQFCFCLRFSMYWTSALLSKALNHAEMQWGLSICLTALLIHILCVQKCVSTLFSKQIQTEDNDSIKDAAAEILFAAVNLWQVY